MVFRRFKTEKFQKLRDFYKRYERWLIPGALVFGFITDLFTFRALGLGRMMYVFLGHLVFAAVNLGAINYFKERKPRGKIGAYWEFAAPLFVQFSFGNLFNGFLIFYSQSGSFFASWPFLLVFVLLMIGNELARRYQQVPVVQVGVYFFVAFSYFNLVFPYIFKTLGMGIFFASGFLSLFLVVGFVYFLSTYSKQVGREKRKLWFVIGVVFLGMNFLYFANLIPPIPLSIKEAGVYHNVERLNGNYRVVGEKCQRWDRCLFTQKRMHIKKERESIYVFSAIHAPLGMSLKVAHVWKKYDPKKDTWVRKARLTYNIKGGRKGGYRLYTYNVVTPGLWRVSIETKRGQVIGQKSFYVVQSDTPPELIENIK